MPSRIDEIKKRLNRATPGPWTMHDEPEHVFKDGSVDRGGYRIDAERIEQLAFIWRDNHRWGDKPTPFGTPEAEASAALIAAAPADLRWLLEVNERLMGALLAWIDYGHLHKLECPQDDTCSCPIATQVNAALSLAREEET